MIGIVHAFGGAARFPLQPCKGGMFCNDPNCDYAIDAGGSLVYEGTIGQVPARGIRALTWADIQSRPGWVNGYPPSVGPNNNSPIWRPIGPIDPLVKRAPISNSRPKCDCGAASADYTISAQGGPGHSDWCKVYGK